jgi:hypothetical protein
MIRKLIIPLSVLCISLSSFGQFRKTEKLEKTNNYGIKIAYLGGVKYSAPGVIIGLEKMMIRKKIVIGSTTRIKEKMITLNLAEFKEPNLGHNLLLQTEYLKRTYYGKSRFFTDFAVGAGYGIGLVKVGGPLFVIDDNGVETKKNTDQDFVLLSIMAGTGYNIKINKDQHLKIFAKAGIYPIYYHAFLYNQFLKGELGLVLPLSFKK